MYSFVHLALKLAYRRTLPCEIRKSYRSSLQQDDDVRNVKAVAEVSRTKSRFHFVNFHRCCPMNR